MGAVCESVTGVFWNQVGRMVAEYSGAPSATKLFILKWQLWVRKMDQSVRYHVLKCEDRQLDPQHPPVCKARVAASSVWRAGTGHGKIHRAHWPASLATG